MENKEILEQLFEKANPIIRYRIATELFDEDAEMDLGILRSQLVNQTDAKYWMKCLKTRRIYDTIHGNYDKSLENSLGKLIQFGITKGISNFDKNVTKHLAWLENIENKTDLPHNNYFLQNVIASLLANAGYEEHHLVREILLKRLKLMYDFTKKKDYDIFIDKALFKDVPLAFENYDMINPELYEDDKFALPWIYDLFAFEVLYKDFKDEIDAILEYVLNKKYQKFPEGYGIIISHPKRFLVVGWNIWLPGFFDFDLNPHQKQSFILRLTLMSNFEPVIKSKWFKSCIEHLNQFKTKTGLYSFPKAYLQEKRNTYYITGSHMGLGEVRSEEASIEIESTFWMMKILKNAKML